MQLRNGRPATDRGLRSLAVPLQDLIPFLELCSALAGSAGGLNAGLGPQRLHEWCLVATCPYKDYILYNKLK